MTKTSTHFNFPSTSIFVVLLAIAMTFFSIVVNAKTNPCDHEEAYPIITKAELTAEIEKKSVTVIDVNGHSSFKNKSVTGAIHYGSNKDKLAKVLPKSKSDLVVAYCGGPKCSAWKKAASAACNLGYTNVKHFKDGIQGW